MARDKRVIRPAVDQIFTYERVRTSRYTFIGFEGKNYLIQMSKVDGVRSFSGAWEIVWEDKEIGYGVLDVSPEIESKLEEAMRPDIGTELGVDVEDLRRRSKVSRYEGLGQFRGN